MATPSTTFTELVSTTFRKHRKDIIDAISQRNALYARLKEKGKMITEDGGLSIVQPLEYAENSTYQRYSGLDLLNIGASDVITSVEFPWRQIAMHIIASGLELRTNSGGSRIINLAKAKMTNAIRSFKNNFSEDMYSDGSLANQITGLQALVADSGQGTIGGINSATWTFWRNIVQLCSAPLQGGGAVTMGPTTIETMMLHLWLAVSYGNDTPDLIVASNDYFAYYEQSQISYKRYTGSEGAKGGFPSLKYKNADVIFDGGSGIPDSHMYFLNTEYINVVAHKAANMTEMDSMGSVNQDAVVIPILWQGNMLCTNRRMQGVLKA